MIVLSILVISALLSGCDKSDRQVATTTPSGNAELRNSTLTRDYQNARLVLDLSVRNTTLQPRRLAPPFIRLLDANDAEIPPFFLAFSQPPTLAPGTSETHELAFWLDESHLAGEIWLVVGEEDPLPVKDADPFELDLIDNQASRHFKGPHWQQHYPEQPGQ